MSSHNRPLEAGPGIKTVLGYGNMAGLQNLATLATGLVSSSDRLAEVVGASAKKTLLGDVVRPESWFGTGVTSATKSFVDDRWAAPWRDLIGSVARTAVEARIHHLSPLWSTTSVTWATVWLAAGRESLATPPAL
jgi:hypothetical protein